MTAAFDVYQTPRAPPSQLSGFFIRSSAVPHRIFRTACIAGFHPYL